MLRTHGPAGIHFKKPSGFPGGFFWFVGSKRGVGGGKASGHRSICPDGAWDWERGLHNYPGSADVLVGRCERIDSNPVPRQKTFGETTYAAFLQNAGLFFREDSQGLHPGLVCDAPTGHGIGNGVLSFLCGANHSHARKERPLVAAGLMSVAAAGALQDGWIVVWCGRWIESSASSPSF